MAEGEPEFKNPPETRRIYRIALIPGDGIGPEVTNEAVRALQTASNLSHDFEFRFTEYPWGTDYYLSHGRMMPDDALTTLATFDAIFLGAVGDPRVQDHITLWGLLLPIRQAFDQYINLRPIRMLPGVSKVLVGAGPDEINMLFVRENTEGEYAGKGDLLYSSQPSREIALQTSVFSRHGIERVIKYAFALGQKLGSSVTSVSKANALNYSGVLWDRVFKEVASQYPTVRSQTYLVDAAAMMFVRNPSRFEVVVASNLFGDILTDLGAGIAGGLGLAASANLNPESKYPSMFEPVHGSAPDIAGRHLANPMASIWAAGLMLNHLGLTTWGERFIASIERVIVSGCTTPDLGGHASTIEVGDAILRELKRDS